MSIDAFMTGATELQQQVDRDVRKPSY